MDFLKRVRNYGLWISLASLVLLILQNLGVHVIADQYNIIVNGILSFLVAAGILNNPTTDNKGYSDDSIDVKPEPQPIENKDQIL